MQQVSLLLVSLLWACSDPLSPSQLELMVERATHPGWSSNPQPPTASIRDGAIELDGYFTSGACVDFYATGLRTGSSIDLVLTAAYQPGSCIAIALGYHYVLRVSGVPTDARVRLTTPDDTTFVIRAY